MRDFFKYELKTLKAKTGLNQFENFSSFPDADFQIKILLDSLIYACDSFPYIPDADKKRIIQDQIIKDPTFTGLHSRVIYNWLNANKDHYWAVAQAKEDPVKHIPVSFDELPGDLQKQINDFKMSLLNGGIKNVPAVSEAEIKAIEKEDYGRIKHDSISKGYQPVINPVREKLMEVYKRKTRENPNGTGIQVFEVDGISISAKSKEEAEEIYIEIIG